MKLTYQPFEKYVLIDLETTGLSSNWDEIIEICCLKVHNGTIIDDFTTLIKPKVNITKEITDITGITNEMVQFAPSIMSIQHNIKDFIEGYSILGHNVTFDINFLKKYLDYDFNLVPYTDTMFLARRLLTSLNHHRLSDLADYFGFDFKHAHRSRNDCLMTKLVYEKLIERIPAEGIIKKKYQNHNFNVNTIVADSNLIDIDNLFYGKYCVFTGVLDKMLRKDATQLVADIGGFPENNVTKKTNYLILGSNDYCKSIKDGKSNKQKKADKLKNEGQDIEIITEEEFYSAFNESNEIITT